MKKKTLGTILVIIAVISIILIYSSITEPFSQDTPADQVLTQEKQETVETYFRENISTLSPQKAVLGGTFYITDIVFHNTNNATVYYEDGHIALKADVRFSVTDDRAITVDSFKIREPDEKRILEESNFHETGALTQGGTTGWRLVYEEPGKPALTIPLAFTDTSQCREKDDWTPCTPSRWPAGAQVEVFGTKKGDLVAIHTLRLPLAKNPERTPPEPTESTLVCEDLCGDSTCQEIVCMGTGCPCAETSQSCPLDCSVE